MDATLAHYLTYLCGAANVFADEPLSRHTTLRVGGPAKFLVKVTHKNILTRLVSALRYLEEPYFILGLGANVLASDQGFAGVVIKIAFREIYHNDTFIYADAGAPLGAVVQYAHQHGLSGLEWATGIPATMGGAVYMNCGAFDHSMQDVVVMVDVLTTDGQVQTWAATQLQFGYRHSSLMDNHAIVLGVYLKLQSGEKSEIFTKMQTFIAKRAQHPREPSAGSIFKKPYNGFYVGKIIEEIGLKGYQIGGAQVSPRHAGFIINTGNATCADILALIKVLKNAVFHATGVKITEEIIILGQI